APLLAGLLAWRRRCRARHGASGPRSPAYAVRRARLASDVRPDWDGALADERDRHWMGAHAVARDAAGGVGHDLADEHQVNSASVGIALVMSTVIGLAGG